jgi:hypothetical protein
MVCLGHLVLDFVHKLLFLILLHFHDALHVFLLICSLDDVFIVLFQHFQLLLLLDSNQILLFGL